MTAERKLLQACRTGEIAVISKQRPQQTTEENTVRAGFLRFLLLGGDHSTPVHERGVRLQGAWVAGELDLENTATFSAIYCAACTFTEPLILRRSSLRGGLFLMGSAVPGIEGDGLVTTGVVFLRDGFQATGTVRLLGAQIDGNLECSNGQFDGKEGDAISTDRAVIKGSVFMKDGFQAIGTVRLLGAQIGSSLECDAGQFDGKEGYALYAEAAVINGSVFLRNGFRAIGEVRLIGAQIGGNLECDAGQFDGKEGYALIADGLEIRGSMFLRNGFQAAGAVRLLQAQIGGTLVCDAGQFNGKEGRALYADDAVINGSVFLRDGFRAIGEVRLMGAQIGSALVCDAGQFDGKESNALMADDAVIKDSVFLGNGFQALGTVRLIGAQIGGDLSCKKGQFNGEGGGALSADIAVINGSVLLQDGFQATGEVRLLGAQIGGNLSCIKGQFDGKGGDALSADGVDIKGSVFLKDGFQAIGKVRLLEAQIGGSLDCGNGKFDGKPGDALCADRMHVAGSFFFRNLASPVNKLSLAGASVGLLLDDAESWGSDLILDCFTYGSISGGAPTSAAARLVWLDKQRPTLSGQSGAGAEFCPQPWKQLQKVLREMGHAEDARQVAIAFEDRLRHADLIGLSPQHWWRGRKWLYRISARGFHYGFRILTGYGYRPIRLLGWFAGVWLACAAFYWFTALPPRNVFAPSNPLVFQNEEYAACVPGSDAAKAEKAKPADAKPSPVKGAGNWYLCEKLRAEYTGFSPLAYSLDVLMPLVDLQQQKDWAPMIPTPKAVWWDELRSSGWKHITRMVVWMETLFGWLASLLLVAIVSGLTKRRED